jgi:proline iminopeptidase
VKTITSLAIVIAGVVLVSCSPADSPSAEEQTPLGLENGSFHTRLNGFDIHYEVHGQGPVVMTLPNSWGLSLEGLRGLYRPLEDSLTMVYFDPRGMGESSPIVTEADMGMAAVRADFQALRQHLGLESVKAIGWSNGAMNLIMLAAEHPETIDNAIFLHGAASYTNEDMGAMAAKYPGLMEASITFNQEMQDPGPTDDEKTEKMRALWLEHWFPMSFADREAAPATINRIFGDAEFSWAHGDYSQREHPEFDARGQLPLITARCLVISGAHDMMPASKGEEMAEGIPSAEFVLFESSGHYAPAEEAEVFEALVFRFLGVN